MPALGNIAFTLNPNNVRQPSGYGTGAVGGEYIQTLIADVAVFAGTDLRLRDNWKNNVFDADNRDLRGGLILGQAANQIRVTASGGRYYLDSALNRETEGVGADWRYQVNPNNQLNLFSQYLRTRFGGELAINSFNSATGGIGGQHVLQGGQAVLFGTVYFGDERDVNRRADGSKRFAGLRLGGNLRMRENLDLFGYVGYQSGKYGRENVAFVTTRKDELSDLSLGINWRFGKDWTLRPQISWSSNSSNIQIYEFTRTDASLALRRDFNF